MPDFLDHTFFDRHHLDVARDLVGTTLVWGKTAGTVVETEAYAATGDTACHVYTRPSSRDFFNTHPPGTAYVYLNYGIHWLLNVLAADGIILFRALEPTAGVPLMRRRRNRDKLTDLCSGPGKLGAALDLSASHHGSTLTKHKYRGLVAAPAPPAITATTRIGISSAQDFPWRFLLTGNPHTSVPPAGIKKSRSHSRERP